MQHTAPVPEQAVPLTASVIGFKTSQGIDMQATVVRLAPQAVTFEIYSPPTDLRVSEALADFKILAEDRVLYNGTAVIRSLMAAGTVTVCDAVLAGQIQDVDLFQLGNPEAILPGAFDVFVNRWQKFHQILPEYKLAVADMQNFLHELRLWLDQIELAVRSLPTGDRNQMERQIVQALVAPTAPAIGAMFERFELAAAKVPPELQPAHHRFCRQQLHPLLLCSPFMYRIFSKPLGYAGDYEMVNMILRDSCEGGSLFAKLLNVHILNQSPGEGHRNRVVHLIRRLVEESNRVMQRGGTCRIYNLGCGPAGEIQNFLTNHELSNHTSFTLLDSNNETLEYIGGLLEGLKSKYGRRTGVRLVKKSVHQLLKMSGKPKAAGEEYDFVYSAGLFDYLNDRVCRTIIGICYDLLAPGGLLLITNVDPVNPIRNIMEHIYEWYLIYRSGPELAQLTSELPKGAMVSVVADATSSNVIVEVRKPS